MKIDEYLDQHNLNRAEVAKISGVTPSTLANAQKNDIGKVSIKVVQSLAMTTGETPGTVLDRLLKLEGSPIIQFIKAHPYLNNDVVQQVENAMIEAHEQGLHLKNITFNRYYEGKDTNENAEKALKNVTITINELINKLRGDNNMSKTPKLDNLAEEAINELNQATANRGLGMLPELVKGDVIIEEYKNEDMEAPADIDTDDWYYHDPYDGDNNYYSLFNNHDRGMQLYMADIRRIKASVKNLDMTPFEKLAEYDGEND